MLCELIQVDSFPSNGTTWTAPGGGQIAAKSETEQVPKHGVREKPSKVGRSDTFGPSKVSSGTYPAVSGVKGSAFELSKLRADWMF
jgi:hypothetical protein